MIVDVISLHISTPLNMSEKRILRIIEKKIRFIPLMLSGVEACMRALVLVALFCPYMLLPNNELRIQVARKDQAAAKTNIALVLTNHDDLLSEIVHTVQTDLEFSGQCSATIVHAHLPTTRQEVESYYAAGYQFVAFLTLADDRTGITGRLYDALDTSMIQGKKWQRREPLVLWAHKIAQDIWMQLMGNPGSFISKIAYVKKTKNRMGKQASQLCLASWDGSNEHIVLNSNFIMVAPSWKPDGELIFCSQFTNRNVRLIAINLAGSSWVVFDRDGTSMGASSVQGCADVVYCHSGEIWKCSYDSSRKRSTHSLVVRDGNMCACPTLLLQGDIIYCAGGRIKQWHAKEGTTSLLTEQGYCTGPAYHAPSKQIVYSQKVGKTMQLCILNKRTGASRQVTTGDGDKIDPSWSPCGTYIVYCLARGKKSEIMLLNSITGETRLISHAGDYCSCPAWSPILTC